MPLCTPCPKRHVPCASYTATAGCATLSRLSGAALRWPHTMSHTVPAPSAPWCHLPLASGHGGALTARASGSVPHEPHESLGAAMEAVGAVPDALATQTVRAPCALQAGGVWANPSLGNFDDVWSDSPLKRPPLQRCRSPPQPPRAVPTGARRPCGTPEEPLGHCAAHGGRRWAPQATAQSACCSATVLVHSQSLRSFE